MPIRERTGKSLLTCGNVLRYIRGFQERKGTEAEGLRWLFAENFGSLCRMDKAEHARLLREAIATSRQYDRQSVEDQTGKGYRTVSNWISETKPSMPRDEDLVVLRRMFPGYDQGTDPVERAVRASRLTEDRQYDVIGFYKRQLRQQDEETGRREPA